MASLAQEGTAPTGPQLLAEIREAAKRAGQSPSTFMLPLTNNPWGLTGTLQRALRPSDRTIARVRALCAGEPLPASDNKATAMAQRERAVAETAALEERRALSRAALERPRDGSTLADMVQALSEQIEAEAEIEQSLNASEAEALSVRSKDALSSASDLIRRCQRDWPHLDARVRVIAAASDSTIAAVWERVIGLGCLALEDELREDEA